MKKLLVTTLLLATMGISNVAMADTKIAVVDVPAVVNKSAQVQALKKEQQTKMQELEKWLNLIDRPFKYKKKFDHLLPDDILNKAYEQQCLDFIGAKNFIDNL